jgi:hypothetical protein
MAENNTDGALSVKYRALHACLSCRRQKKSCNKSVPACSSCLRLKRTCRYEQVSRQGPEDFKFLRKKLSCLEETASTGSSTAATFQDLAQLSRLESLIENNGNSPNHSMLSLSSVFFLHVEALKKRKLKGCRLLPAVPEQVLVAIGDEIATRATVETHFSSTFTWMEILSKKKLHQSISVPLDTFRSDVALLVLSMKLVDDKHTEGNKNPRTVLYYLAKDFYRSIESNGFDSIRLLQAGVFIALYELGHAIYPQAYLTIGHRARVGQAIGLQRLREIP